MCVVGREGCCVCGGEGDTDSLGHLESGSRPGLV